MNLDFHYYATYLAATVAGYEKQEAQTIAYACELVDDNTERTFSKKLPFEVIATSRELEDVLAETANFFVAYTEADEEKAKEIWSYFHFLPGNDGRVDYQGEKSKTGWKYDEKAQKQFAYLCLPESQLSGDLIRDSVTAAYPVKKSLQMIGIKMHILADTWAHAYFSGLPEWHLNDLKQTKGLDEYVNGSWKHIHSDVTKDDNPNKNTYCIAKVASARFMSPVYLGHVQLGYIPDYGFIRYRYHPVWKSECSAEGQWQERDNTEYFLNAFKQMVSALRALRKGTKYENKVNRNVIDSSLSARVSQVLKTRSIDQSEQWRQLILEYTGAGVEKYCKNQWRDKCQNSPDYKNTDYYKFMLAAISHRDYMRNYLQRIPFN